MNGITIRPPELKPGDNVALIAPSGLTDPVKTEMAVTTIESWGLKVLKGKYLYERYGIFAGTDDQRLADLQDALDNPEVKAIICARGGYGLSRIINRLNFDRFRKNPRWIVGYSDITVLHLFANCNHGISTLHGEMPLNFHASNLFPESLTSLKKVLFGEYPSYRWEPGLIVKGEAEGIITGGNLSLVYNLMGTGIRKCLKDKILFLEERGEYIYAFDRMITGLALAGVFENIRGLIVGGLSEMKESDTKYAPGVRDIVMQAVSGYGYPVAFDFPAGHIPDNRALILGSEVRLKAEDRKASLRYLI